MERKKQSRRAVLGHRAAALGGCAAAGICAVVVAAALALSPGAPSTAPVADAPGAPSTPTAAPGQDAGANTTEQEQAGAQAPVAGTDGAAKPDHVDDVALVRFADGTSAKQASAALSGLDFVADASVSKADLKDGIVKVPLKAGTDEAQAAEKLEALDAVSISQPDYLYYPDEAKAVSTNDLNLADQWYLDSIGARKAWGLLGGVKDYSVTIAVIDTGCRITHEDLPKETIAATYDAQLKVENRAAFKDTDQTVGHGTLVSGIIAAKANNGKHGAGIGYNKLKVLPISVFGSDTYRPVATSSLCQAYDYIQKNARKYNIRVVNMSFGGIHNIERNTSDKMVLSAIEKTRTSCGVLPVASAGNKNSTATHFPGDGLTGGLSVIATDQNDKRTSFSNYNASSKASEAKKQLSAPGIDIYAPSAGGDASSGWWTGTSFAAPIVSACAGLLFAAKPNLTTDQVRQILINTATDINTPGFDAQTGFGKVNVFRALCEATGAYSLSGADIAATTDKTYTGSAITPTPRVKVDGKTLKKGTDFEYSYANNVNAGTATITVTGKGDYRGSKKVTFRINPRSATGATVTGVTSRTYNGAAQTQAPTVKVGGRTLRLYADYTLSYTNNVNVGTATVTVTGKGNYTGSKATTFKIAKFNIAGATVTGVTNRTYNGAAQTQNPTVKIGNATLKLNTDYTLSHSGNKNAGIASVTVKGKGNNCSGSKKIAFTIAKASIANASVTVGSCAYTGAAQKPAPTVKLGGNALKLNTDYTVSYANNVNVGTATVTITGKGNYAGTKKVTFAITKPSVAGATVSAIAKKRYTGKAQTPTPTVKLGGRTLRRNTDYTLSYSNNVNRGTATVTITGAGNYAGAKKVTFTIY